MPVPIVPVNDMSMQNTKDAGLQNVDYSFLFNQQPVKEASKLPKVSDKDAAAIMAIWKGSDQVDDGTFRITSESGLTNKDILRLKTYGLITGGTDKVKLTQKGRAVITTMALGETSRFSTLKKDKSYTEILASISKKGKKGYRIPTFASDNNNMIRVG